MGDGWEGQKGLLGVAKSPSLPPLVVNAILLP